MDGWFAPGTSANSETEAGLAVIRDRHRQLVRDNPYASRAVGVIEANVGFLTPAFEGPNAKAAEKLWKAWAKSLDCDAEGQHDLDGLQSMVMRGTVESGEILVRRRRRRIGDGLVVPLQLQLLEPDLLDSSADFSRNSNIVQGVEFDRLGRRVRYHLFKNHPGDSGAIDLGTVKISADSVAHVYRQDRPGQVRGVPWGAPVMVRLKGFDEYEDAQLMRQKIAACFSVFVTDPHGESDKTRVGYADKISPGLVKRLGSGEDVEFANPPGVDGYGEYSVEQKHAIAAGYGIPYASMTGDRRQVNFSSGKMAEVDFLRNITNWQRRILQQKFCQRIWKWFKEAAALLDHDFSKVEVTWTPPRRALIDPSREITPLLKAVDGALIPRSEVHRGLSGRSSEDVVKEIEEHNEALRKAGLEGLVVGQPAKSVP